MKNFTSIGQYYGLTPRECRGKVLPGGTGFVAGAILVYAAFNSRGLLQAWRDSPFDRSGWIAFLIWSAPVVILAVRKRAVANPSFLIASLGATVAGVAAALNVLCYAGLALAIAAFVPMTCASVIWLFCSAGWMPAVGYFVSKVSSEIVHPTRIILALIGSSILLWTSRNR